MPHLAINGGPVTRTQPYPSWPVYTENDARAVSEVVMEGKWGNSGGGRVAKFQENFAAYQDADHGICVTNGTTALILALQVVGIEPGDEVIVPAYTFIATANAVLMVNAVPVFVDMEPETFNIDPDQVEAAVTPKTRAIIPVHFAGLPADLDRLSAIARKHRLAIVEDAAQAHGARWDEKGVGAQGAIGTFSFQGSKNLNAGEGGIILTNADNLAGIARSLTNCGRAEDGLGYNHYHLAGNNRMSELQGALLLSQMERLEEQTRLRSENAEYLSEQLGMIDGINPSKSPAKATRHARHLYIFRYNSDAFGGTPKQRFIAALRAEGIPTSPGYGSPLYQQPIFVEKNFGAYAHTASMAQEYGSMHLPETERACSAEAVWFSQNVLLGSKEDMDDIIRAISKIRERKNELEGASR